MNLFKKKNEIGIEFECAEVAQMTADNDKYIIYTNFVSNNEGELNLFVGKIENGTIRDVDRCLELEIIQEYLKTKEVFLNQLLEGNYEI